MTFPNSEKLPLENLSARPNAELSKDDFSSPFRSPGESAAESFNGRAPKSGSASFGAFSRDEMNLAEFPLAALSTRVDPSVKTLEFSDTQRLKNGELAKREWIITGADKFGLPTSTDDDVILGLIRLTMDHGFRSRKVHFTRYELMQILRWAPEGRNYTRLTRSLDRLSGVRIKATNAFFDNSSKSFQTCNFGIIDAYEIVDGRNAKSSPDSQHSFFIWSEVLFDSFKSGFIKKLDLNLYFSLKSAVSRRLYRYLDKHFYFRPVIERPLMMLAFEKLGLSRNYRYVSSVKQQLEPAFEELIGLGFLNSFEYSGRGEGTLVRLTGSAQGAGVPSQYSSSQAGSSPAGFAPGGNSKYQSRGAFGPSGGPSGRRPGSHSTSGSAASGPAPLSFSFEPRSAAVVGSADDAPVSRTESSHGPVSRTPASRIPGQGAAGDLSQFESHLIHSLRGRGLTDDQAQRLIRGRGSDGLRMIHQIVGYYDFLVLTGDPRISKSPVGFLYKAVENPERFTVPANYSTPKGTTDGSSTDGFSKTGGFSNGGERPGLGRERLGKLRPELRIVRAERAAKPAGIQQLREQGVNRPAERVTPERLTIDQHFARLRQSALVTSNPVPSKSKGEPDKK